MKKKHPEAPLSEYFDDEPEEEEDIEGREHSYFNKVASPPPPPPPQPKRTRTTSDSGGRGRGRGRRRKKRLTLVRKPKTLKPAPSATLALPTDRNERKMLKRKQVEHEQTVKRLRKMSCARTRSFEEQREMKEEDDLYEDAMEADVPSPIRKAYVKSLSRSQSEQAAPDVKYPYIDHCYFKPDDQQVFDIFSMQKDSAMAPVVSARPRRRRTPKFLSDDYVATPDVVEFEECGTSVVASSSAVSSLSHPSQVSQVFTIGETASLGGETVLPSSISPPGSGSRLHDARALLSRALMTHGPSRRGRKRKIAAAQLPPVTIPRKPHYAVATRTQDPDVPEDGQELLTDEATQDIVREQDLNLIQDILNSMDTSVLPVPAERGTELLDPNSDDFLGGKHPEVHDDSVELPKVQSTGTGKHTLPLLSPTARHGLSQHSILLTSPQGRSAHPFPAPSLPATATIRAGQTLTLHSPPAKPGSGFLLSPKQTVQHQLLPKPAAKISVEQLLPSKVTTPKGENFPSIQPLSDATLPPDMPILEGEEEEVEATAAEELPLSQSSVDSSFGDGLLPMETPVVQQDPLPTDIDEIELNEADYQLFLTEDRKEAGGRPIVRLRSMGQESPTKALVRDLPEVTTPNGGLPEGDFDNIDIVIEEQDENGQTLVPAAMVSNHSNSAETTAEDDVALGENVLEVLPPKDGKSWMVDHHYF